MNWHQGDKLEIPIIGVVEFTGQLLGLLWFKVDDQHEIGLEPQVVEARLQRPTMWRRVECITCNGRKWVYALSTEDVQVDCPSCT